MNTRLVLSLSKSDSEEVGEMGEESCAGVHRPEDPVS